MTGIQGESSLDNQDEKRIASSRSPLRKQTSPKQGDAGEGVQAQARNDAAGIPWDHRCEYTE